MLIHKLLRILLQVHRFHVLSIYFYIEQTISSLFKCLPFRAHLSPTLLTKKKTYD
nr:MAG TPA: hypothetical protein [Caudoviricetes sp.]DAS50141.1 MAG TPA: hypothetical protein [Caudoviricetes sp.]